VVFFKLGADGDIHVSMRSKYDVNVREIAARHGGGGHKNAAGFKVKGPLDAVRGGILRELGEAIDLGAQSRP
jgi:phosphoesterase RecJ-like protein